MIEAQNLTKVYEDGLCALDHVSFGVKAGEIFCLLGDNGAGKTTAINLFLGFLDPTEGVATINGIDVKKDPLEAKRFVAYLSDIVMLYPNFSARQNLDFFARLGGKQNLTRDDYYSVLRQVGLQEKAFEQKLKGFSKGMKLKGFSKGMRQKVGLAIAIIKDAPAIILDEPTSGLDPKAANEFLAILHQLRAQGRAILMSTHDIFRAKEVADIVGIMAEGKILATKSRSELEHENLERLYLSYIHGKAAA
ncbi:MAG: ABC transporter ATP-binding protein [Ignavibacteria bacterium]|nr:ABC transporter ATP-binding protein [Ignavibacteria bacterium]